jgi:PAS domain S-box-containing protein
MAADRSKATRDAELARLRLRVAELERAQAEAGQAQRALRESEERYRSLAEAAHDMIFIVDADDRVEYVNRYACESVGTVPEAVVGHPRSELFRAGDGARQGQALRHVLQTGQPLYTQQETRFGEATLWLDTWLVPLRAEDGRVRAVLGISRDVSTRKRAELEHRELQQRLQETQKLESLGVLAGGIAHDFNNLLTGILGYASLVQADLAEDCRARAGLREIELAARRATELTRQLLAYSGRGKFVVQPLDLGELVQEMGELLRVSIPKKVRLEFALAPGLPAVEADGAQVRQIAMNLLLNAAEAIGDQAGVIVVRTGLRACDRAYLQSGVLHDELPEGDYVFLEVQDTGCGMSAEVRARIFDPFFSTKFTGRGLGLAAALGAVRSHRGSIQVDSAPGRGSTFRVLFPPTERRPEAARRPAAPARLVAHGLALVVDDEPSVRSLASAILGSLGFEVLTATDGREALSSFEARAAQVAIVLLDLNMPVMDGEETLRAIRRLRPEVPVLLSSGYGEADATRRFAGLALAGFVQKPYSRDELVEAVQRVLAS